MKRHLPMALLVASVSLMVAGCSGEQSASARTALGGSGDVAEAAPVDDEGVARSVGWTEETHGNEVAPDYEIVFPQGKVNRITITLSPEDWAAMQANMTQLLGAPGTGRGGAGARGGFAPPQGGQQQNRPLPGGGAFPPGGQQPGQPPAGGVGGPGGMGGAPDMTPENPIWVPATIKFEGSSWTNVGVRYKGNSTLQQAWSSGSSKIGLKLDFDEFEDEHPEIENQRFYGFKQLSLSNNFGDATYMRETVAYDLLEEAGLPAANTAFYEVVLDHGEGQVSLGIYTMVEVIDDTVVDRYFGEDKGNIYEADGSAASLAQGTAAQIKNSFQQENNEEAADWSDVEALYDVLHSTERTSDPASWRSKLEAVFDVNSFLEWLAISAAIGHWDTYGQMSHNYYLYDDPDTGKLAWISWDHNYVLGAGPGGGAGGQAGGAPGGGAGRPGGGMGSVSLDKKGVGANWPLIRYLLDDPTYYAGYVDYLRETVDGAFNPDKMEAKYQELARLLEPYASREGGQQPFQTAVQSLVQATRDRAQAVTDFLATQPSGSR